MQTLPNALRRHPIFNRADEGLTVQEAFDQGGLDYQVETRSIYVQNIDGSYNPVPERVATTRTDTERVLGVVSPYYSVVQNSRGISFLENFFAEGGDDVEVIGSGTINRGEKVFISFQLGDTWMLPGTQDAFTHTLTWGTGHDGGTAFDLIFREFRMVCTNGMIVEGMRTRFSLKHSSSIEKLMKVQTAREALGFGYNVAEDFEAELNKLYEQEVTDAEFEKIVRQLVPVPEEEGRAQTLATDRLASVRRTWNTNPALKGSALGVYNAFNEMEQWGAGDRPDADRTNDRALYRTLNLTSP